MCPVPGCGKPLKGLHQLYVHFLKGYERPAEALYCCAQHASHLVSYTGGDLNAWRTRAQTWYTHRFTRDAWSKAFQATRSVYEEMMKQRSERRKRLKSESVQTTTTKERKRKTSTKPASKKSKRNKVERKQTKATPKKKRKTDSSTESSAKKKIKSGREDVFKFIIPRLEKVIHSLSEITDYLKNHR